MTGLTAAQNQANPRLWRSVLLASASGSVIRPTGQGADAILIDSRTAVREVEALRHRGGNATPVFAQVSAEESRLDEALDALMQAAPDGIAVAGFSDGASIELLGARIAAREAMFGLADRSTSVVAIVSTGAAVTQLHTLSSAGPRLAAIGWDAEALAGEIGAVSAWENGGFIEPLIVVRSLCLAAAAAAGLPAIDTRMPAAADGTDFLAEARRASRHGFAGKFARSAEEVEILNEIFVGQPRPTGPRS